MTAQHITAIDRRMRSAQVEKALLYGILSLLLFGPLAFGAVEPWAIFALETGSVVLFFLWIAQLVLDGEIFSARIKEGEIKVRSNPLFLPMAAFGGLIALQLLFRVTAYAHDTFSLALLYFAYALLCFLANQVLLRGPQARSLALIFSIYGAALAGFALVQGISSNGKLYWIRQPRMGGWIYGPYVNHNHYAGLMEMLVPIPLIVSLGQIVPAKLRAAAGAAAAIMVGTIFLSGSRGGMLAVSAEFIIVAALLVQQKRGFRTALAIALFLALVVGLLAWIGGDELMRRIASVNPGHSDIAADIRYSINRDGLRMFLKKPILGWGLGSFPTVYPQFRTFYTNFFVNQAHDDYLQLLIETGTVGFAIMLWFLAALYRRALQKAANWTSDISGAMSVACILGVSGILVHSAVDFNLEIPANAALFFVLCTTAAADPLAKPARKRRAARSQPAEDRADSEAAPQPYATNF
jgi:O-antigen ligase